MNRLLRPFALLLVLLIGSGTPLAQTPTARTATVDDGEATERVGYLLAGSLFAEPNAFAGQVEAVGRDERVRVVAVEGTDEEGWYAVYRDGETKPAGYAHRPYVSRFDASGRPSEAAPASAETSSPDAQPEAGSLPEVAFVMEGIEGTACVVETWAHVRSGPGMGYQAIGLIRPGTPFRVVDVERGWGEVRLEGDRPFGYVSGALLRRIEIPTTTQHSFAHGGGTADTAPPSPASTVQETPAAPRPAAAAEELLVYVTRHGRKFHRHDCNYLRSSAIELSLSEAQKDYTPCRVCRPLDADRDEEHVDGEEHP